MDDQTDPAPDVEPENFPWFDWDVPFYFPPVDLATEDGVVASGGNLSPGVLLSAYRQGIFPWYSEGRPLLWWSPDPRFVLYPEELHISGSMARWLKKTPWSVTFDADFSRVIEACAAQKRPRQRGTWITRDMRAGYKRLHELGFAHSVEVWDPQGTFLGGLYGVALGRVFFGESMVSLVSNASKTAFLTLGPWLKARGFRLIDSQVHTAHLESLGARHISRQAYLAHLADWLEFPGPRGSWAGLEKD